MANMALDGLSQQLLEKFPRSTRGTSPKVNLARYADDFIVTGASKELLEQEVKPFIEAFLKERGLLMNDNINSRYRLLEVPIRKESSRSV
jgi:RNA-directed DNA polymerase